MIISVNSIRSINPKQHGAVINEHTVVKKMVEKHLSTSWSSRIYGTLNLVLGVAVTADPQTALEQLAYILSRSRRVNPAAVKRRRRRRVESERKAR